MRAISAAAAALTAAALANGAGPLKIVTLNPGHFHAALIQKEQLPELSEEAWVYAPLGPDLAAHLNRIAGFNGRKDNPTRWCERIYAGPDYWGRMMAERPGQIVVLSGANRGKIERIHHIAASGLHTLADKPWIIEHRDLAKLAAALDEAEKRGVVAYDGMTQRYEVSCILQRELVGDDAVFGTPLAGSPAEPAVYMESVHYLLKLVAGVPNLRPGWFFDIEEQGEGLADVGTHLVDLVQWILYPSQAIDYQKDIRVLEGKRWPTPISAADFERVTGRGRADTLDYYCNNSVLYTIRGVHTRLDVEWGFEAPPGQLDTELAVFRGSRARVEVRQGKEENFQPEVYVVPNHPEDKPAIRAALDRKVEALEAQWRGLAVADEGARLRVLIPREHRIGHEAHFALLVSEFLKYVKNPAALPAWEKPNMLAKYYVTTKGVELARQGGNH
jgi:predicted dehydrogenase